MNLRLGVIGGSEGNGHPYSWSAIFNGYDAAAMRECGYPVIPEYLAAQDWPQARIPDAEVTCVWTQDRELSEHIARASFVGTVVDDPHDMLGQVDALLLARDDAENHLLMATPFLAAGIPVYIDKPLALSLQELDRLYALECFAGQIFSCSALRYARELSLSARERELIGPLREIHAITPKGWDKYAIHLIDPVLDLVDADDEIMDMQPALARPAGGALTVRWRSGLVTRFVALGREGVAPIMIHAFGCNGWRSMTFEDSFSAFREALVRFVNGVRSRSVATPRSLLERSIRLLEAGRSGVDTSRSEPAE